MDDLPERQKQQIGFLLADFKAIKDEIARRSNLQRIVLVLYLTAMAAIYWRVSAAGSSNISIFLITVLAAFLAGIYYWREALEIIRLGKLITINIAEPAGKILDVAPALLLPSEVIKDPDNQNSRLRKVLNRLFLTITFIIPLLMIGYLFFKDSS